MSFSATMYMSSMNGQMTLIPATSSRLFSMLAHVTGQPLLASFLAMLTGFLILDCMNSIGFLLYLTLKSSFSTSNFVFTSLMAHEYIIMISSKLCISCMKGFSSGRRSELMYLLFRAFVCIDSITPPKCKKTGMVCPVAQLCVLYYIPLVLKNKIL